VIESDIYNHLNIELMNLLPPLRIMC